jgi:hypothetical protein
MHPDSNMQNRQAPSFRKRLHGKGETSMLWITRSHVHVDRVAHPWLITRFVDNEAEFLFAPKNQIEEVAKETGAIPFDAPGVELGHKDGRCSFESIMLQYELKEPGLVRLAQIVHAADAAETLCPGVCQ